MVPQRDPSSDHPKSQNAGLQNKGGEGWSSGSYPARDKIAVSGKGDFGELYSCHNF